MSLATYELSPAGSIVGTAPPNMEITMGHILLWILGAAVLYLIIRNIPDALRYIRISRM
ncbi:MAG: hypothetical protein NVS9B4_23490 [Candidatus Acidiferrum sp.]